MEERASAPPDEREQSYDAIVIGGGQAGLATGYYLQRTGLRYLILDAEPAPGGAWRHTWHSLRLFSPAAYSSLPGWLMPGGSATYPGRDNVIEYLAQYEARYKLPLRRPVDVHTVRRSGERLAVETDRGRYLARAVVSATGTLRRPFIPDYAGRESFEGLQLHSAEYRQPQPFAGKRVLIIGGGNSAAQILAEVSQVAQTLWVTLEPPRFLPDAVDGRALFQRASARYRALREGANPEPLNDLGAIVMVPPVREARERGVLRSVRPFARFTTQGVVWPDEHETPLDAVIWCTGFRPALDHLRPLGAVTEDGRLELAGTRSLHEPRLWLVGYGNWTGFASATLIGVGRTARATVRQIEAALRE